MTLQPKNGYILAKAVEQKKATDAGIALPEGVEEDGEQQTSYAEIVAICQGSEYNIGDTILFSKMVPDDVMTEIDGEKQLLHFIKETDIKAKVE